MKSKQGVSILLMALGLMLVDSTFAQVGAVRGEVVDEDGNPISDVEITIQGIEVRRNYRVKTNRQGKYLHAGVSLQGSYRVIAEKEGYQSDYVEGIRPAMGGGEDPRATANFTLRKGDARPLAFELTDEQKKELERRQEEIRRQQEVAQEVAEGFEMGRTHLRNGEYEQAVTVFNQVLEKDDKQPAVWGNLGSAYARLRQHDQAIQAYEKALELRPDESAFLQNIGSVYADKGDIDKAREYYEKAAGVAAAGDPKSAAVNYFNMGITFINAGRSQEALDALQKAVAADPSLAEAHYQLGLTYLGVNQMDEALEHLRKYLELAPQGPNAEVAKQLIEQLG